MPLIVTVLLIILASLVGLCVLLLLLYLLVFIRLSTRRPPDETLLVDYAHRGLHGGGVPENSLAAFRLAVEVGYGIELDVQLSRDGEVMVFHDYTLARMTGHDGKLSDHNADELATLRLADTAEHIPTLAEVLALVDGQVPLLVELKGESFNTALAPKVAAMLAAYRGRYCIESFNPLLLRKMRQLLPDALAGLLYTNVIREKKCYSALHITIALMTFNFLCHPRFIAYNEVDRNAIPVKLATRFYHAPRFVWTVRSREAFDIAHTLGEYAIFEKLDRD